MEKIRIVEVGPRDGLQNISKIIPTEKKVDFINRLSSTGLQEIEVTSFVSPQWVPQLSDAVDVSAAIKRNPSVRYTALVPNEIGLSKAIDSGYESVAFFTTSSETFSRKNTNHDTPGNSNFNPLPSGNIFCLPANSPLPSGNSPDVVCF